MQDLLPPSLRRRPAHAPRVVRRSHGGAQAVRMRGAVQMAASSDDRGPDRLVYQPGQLLARYQRAKVVGGTLFVAIFAGWMWLQWSNPWMRGLTAVLLLLTVWLTASSILSDLRRHQGRQIELAGRALLVTTPQGTTWIDLADVDYAQWLDDTGLSFVRADGATLGTIDLISLADEDEARRLMSWLRQHAGAGFTARWPQRA